MDLGLQDKAVLVLGASSGIGRGVALELAREGADVMLFSRSEGRLRETAESIAGETGKEPRYFAGDLADPDALSDAVEATVDAFGGLWALFNNGGGPPAGSFDQFGDAEWQAAFEGTLLGYVRTIRAALPHLRRAGGGRIVNNTSASTRQAIDGLLLSNSLRPGVIGLTKTLARELGPEGILVNAVGAGRIDTDRVRQLDGFWGESEGRSGEEQRRTAEEAIPLRRYGSPAEFGRVVAFLCSSANGYLTGQNLVIDGGLVAAY